MRTSGCHFNITHSYKNFWNTESHLTELITLEKVIFYSLKWEFKWTNTYENFWVQFFLHNPHLQELLEHSNLFKWVNHNWSSHVLLISVRIEVNHIYQNNWMPFSHYPHSHTYKNFWNTEMCLTELITLETVIFCWRFQVE